MQEFQRVCSNEEMDLLLRCEKAAEEHKLPTSMFLHRLRAEGVAQIKDESSCLKNRVKGMCFSTSRFRLEEDLIISN